MTFPEFLQKLSSHFPLPSAAELDSLHFEAHYPYPEFTPVASGPDSNQPTMSLAWLKNIFSREILNEKTMLPTMQEPSSTRTSEDLESLASSDASTLLENERAAENPKRKPAVDARIVSDAIIGLSDGLTVPFALTAGLSALGDTKVVIYGGVAELIAGAISMGLGGYLGAKSEE